MNPRQSASRVKLAALLLGASLLVPGLAAGQENCVTAECHATLLKAKTVHPAAEDCDSCHESVATPHPQKGKKTFKLTQEPPALCETCHDAFGKKSVVHPPVKDGDCTTCHDPHSSNQPKLLRPRRRRICAAPVTPTTSSSRSCTARSRPASARPATPRTSPTRRSCS